MTISVASRKQKARKLQQLLRDLILKAFPSLTTDDCRSTPMGSQGQDVMLSTAARAAFNYSPECKSQERLNLYASWNQAVTNASPDSEPLLVVKKNHGEALAVIRLEHFMELVQRKNEEN